MKKTILVANRPISEIPKSICESLEREDVYVLSFAHTWSDLGAPDAWNRCQQPDEVDESEIRCAVLAFLEDWPKRKLCGDRCFDDLFRRLDGYSVWWTSVGASRVSSSPLIRTLKRLWVLDKNFRTLGATRIVAHLDAPILEEVIGSRFGKSLDVEFASSSDNKSVTDVGVNFRWLFFQIAKIPFSMLKFIAIWLAVRLVCPRIKRQKLGSGCSSIVFAPKLSLSRNIRVASSGIEVPYWDSVTNLLKERDQSIRPAYMLNYKGLKENPWSVIGWLRGEGRTLLRNLVGAARPVNAYSGLTDWLRALPNQLRGFIRFFQVSRNGCLRQTMLFMGFDVSGMLIPLLQKHVEGLAGWERSLGQLTACCSSIPNAKLVCVLGEFYPGSMQLIAAAKRLGLQVLGVQHGTICPDHYVYTIPRGHLTGAPIPDYFAVYGEYSRWVVTEVGHFSLARTRIVGAPRLDGLVSQRKEKVSARERLGLSPSSKVILFSAHTTRNFPWFVDVAKAVCFAALDHQDCIVCVKFHPGETQHELYERAVRATGNSNVMYFRDEYESLLAACDVLISGSSTTILEAVLMRTPSIAANFTGMPDRYPYVADGAALPARDPDELRESLNSVFDDRGLKSCNRSIEGFLERHVGPTVFGGGTERLATLIQSVVENSSLSCRGLDTIAEVQNVRRNEQNIKTVARLQLPQE